MKSALQLRNKSVTSQLWQKMAHTPWHILNCGLFKVLNVSFYVQLIGNIILTHNPVMHHSENPYADMTAC